MLSDSSHTGMPAIRGLLLDVEGVLVVDKRYTAVESAPEFIREIRRRRLAFRLITNNTTDSRPGILSKLQAAGFDFRLEEIHTCISAATTFLHSCKVQRCFVLGNDDLRRMFSEAGFTVMETSDVEAVIVGYDTELTYERLAVACEALLAHRARLVALHKNRVLRDPAGRSAPSVGAIVAALEYATQVEAVVMGKPSAGYFGQALDELQIPATEVLVVSDDPLSDLAGAKRVNAALRTAFTLSGKYASPAILEKVNRAERPDIVVARLGELLKCAGLF